MVSLESALASIGLTHYAPILEKRGFTIERLLALRNEELLTLGEDYNIKRKHIKRI